MIGVTLHFMTTLPLQSLIQVVEHLPTPVVVVNFDGFVVASSPAARDLLLISSTDGSGVHLSDHLDSMPLAPRAMSPTPIESDEGHHELIGLTDRLARVKVPGDVATLAGEVAHDFNNLLGVIINFASLAASDLQPGSEAERDLREVIIASKRGAVITQRLLDVGRMGHTSADDDPDRHLVSDATAPRDAANSPANSSAEPTSAE